MRCRRNFPSFFKAQRGASGVEYAFLLGFVSLVTLGEVVGFGGKVDQIFGGAGDAITVATDKSNGGGSAGGGNGDSGGGGSGGGVTTTMLLDPSITLTVNDTNAWELDGYYDAGAEGSALLAYEVTGTTNYFVYPYLTGACTALTNETLPWAPTGTSGSQLIEDDGSLTGCSYHLNVEAEDGWYYEAVTIDFDEVIVPDWTIDATLNGDKTFVIVGPGDSVDLDWAMTVIDEESYGYREIRFINGICPADGTNPPIETIDGNPTGSQQIEWDEDYAGCFAEFTFGVTDVWDPNSFLESKTVAVAFTEWAAATPVAQSMTINGEEEVTIGVGGTAHFEWSSTMPLQYGTTVYKDSACSSINIANGFDLSGTLDQAWSTTVRGCDITLCIEGGEDLQSDSVESCATAHFISDDTTPNAMVFPTLFDQAPSTLVNSNAVTVSGINTPTTLTISAGGSVSKNGGTAVTGSVTVSNGDSIVIQATTPSSASGDLNITLTRTNFSANWRVLNTAGDQTPTMGNFTSKTNQPVATQVYSNIVVPSAYAAMPISVANGTAVINNGGSTGALPGSTSGVMNSGNGIFLTTATPATPNTAKTVTVNYGPGLALSTTWSVTTAASANDQMPGQFTFNTDLALSNATTTQTVPIKPTGFDTPFYLEVEDAPTGSVDVCVNGSCSAGGALVNPGDDIVLKMSTDDVCGDIDFFLKESSGGTIFAESYWTACPWFGPDEEDITCSSGTVAATPTYSVSLPAGYNGQIYPKRRITDGPGLTYADQEFYFGCGATEWSFLRSGSACSVGLSGPVNPEAADPAVFNMNKGRCAMWMGQVHNAAVSCATAQATNMSACVTANSPTPPRMCHRNFTGEYIICDDPDVDGDGYGDWDGNNWVTSIKG